MKCNCGKTRLVKAEELAESLCLHRTTVYRLVLAGVIPVVRIGRAVRFDLTAVREALEQKGEGGGNGETDG